MFEVIRKRDGREMPFDETKITDAIFRAARAVGGEDRQLARELTIEVLTMLKEQYSGRTFGVEEVQDVVEKALIEAGHARTAKAYILYRDRRTRIRDAKGDLMDAVEEILAETNRENSGISSSPLGKMLLIAGAASKKYYLTRLVPEDMSRACLRGDIHINDLGFYGKTLHCLQVPLGRLLAEGFNTGHGYIRAPRRPTSATALAAIMLQSAQNDMHGGQSLAFFDRDMAPYVGEADDFETYQAMEALIYNLNSMHSRAQVPFSTLNLGAETGEAARRVIRSLLLAYHAGLGRGESPIFPNIVFRVKEGVNLNPGDPNYDLFQLAIKVAAKRLNPTFSFMDASFNSKYGSQASYTGCCTRVMANRRKPVVTEGRGNLSLTTVNLPRVALSAGRDLKRFHRKLSEVMDLAIRQLHHRFRVQAGLKVRDMPFIMGQGLFLGSGDLKPDDAIAPVIVHGTLSMGFIGLAEALVALTGEHHGRSGEARELGLGIVARMRERIDEACEEYDLNYTLQASPAESLCGRLMALDRKEFGTIPGVTDKGYYTNSFHIPVDCSIGGYDKISIEGPYHKYCNGGHISHVEMAAPPGDSLQAVEALIRHMAASDMGYGAINFPVDFCTGCNLLGVIGGDRCPSCGSLQIRRVRRITGYLAAVDRFNDSKLAELRDRTPHF